MKVLVCGGRNYGATISQRSRLYGVLLIHKPTTIITGGATGADFWARKWAWQNGVPTETFPADWEAHGKAAGPIRNQLMLQESCPDIVVAFPGGRGTADMARRAKAAGVKVLEVSDGG